MADVFVQAFSAFPGAWPERSYDRFHKQKYVKAKPSEFEEFWARQPEALKKAVTPIKGNPRFAKLVWTQKSTEKVEEGNESQKPRILKNKYVKIICIDPKSEHAGNIYNDDSKALIYSKLTMLALGRPFHLVVKTLYHLTLIGVAKAIFDGVKKKETPKEIGLRVVRAFVDMFRTPLYELILIVVALTAVLVSPFKPTLLYDFRAFTGKLSHELYWGKRFDLPVDLNPCMRREYNVMDFEKNAQDINENKVYKDPNDPVLVALDNL